MTMYDNGQDQHSRRHYPNQQEDIYAEDTDRLYESFNDLYEDFDDGRSKTPFVIIGALLAIAVVGGGLAFAYKRGFQGTPPSGVPIVTADRSPAKVAPNDPGGLQIPHQDSLIFDRINGEAAEVNSNMPQAGGTQTPSQGAPLTIGDLASQVTTSTGNNQPIAMAGTPTSQGEALLRPAGNGQAPLPKPLLPPGAAAPQQAPAVLSPRKVETFTITPDGRIVSQTVDAPQQPAGRETALMPAGSPLAAPANGNALQVPALPSVIEQIGTPSQPDRQVVDLGASQDIQPSPPALQGGGTSSLAPSPRPKPRPTTRDLAAVQQQPAAQPARQTVSSSSGENFKGKFAVQVASNQRQSDSLAIFADLQRRYPDLVKGYRPLIQRADLGSRGIFYRLRIGPVSSKADANRLCSSLRTAGLPGCIVRSL